MIIFRGLRLPKREKKTLSWTIAGVSKQVRVTTVPSEIWFVSVLVIVFYYHIEDWFVLGQGCLMTLG